jgi:hypothetical protein
MSWTQADVARLKAAIASGQLSVRYGDRQISYQSTDAMLTALDRMQAEVAANSGEPRQSTHRFTFTTLRGF